MTSQSVNRLTDKHAMVPSVNRKPREYLTHTERLDHLHHVSNKNRDRANFTNKLENFRLRNKNKQLDSNELQHMRAFLKLKNDLKFSLVDIAKTKRRLNGSETAFERHLRDGSNKPVFLTEYNRLRQKEHELQLLKDRLEAPNSQILAKRVIDELRNIELRSNMASDELRMGKFNLLPPISTTDDIERSDVINVTEDNPEGGINNNLQNVSSMERNVLNQPEPWHKDNDKTDVRSKTQKYRKLDKVTDDEANNYQSIKGEERRKHARNNKFKRKRYSNGYVHLNLQQPIELRANNNNTDETNKHIPYNVAQRTETDIERRERETEERLTGLKEKTRYDIQRRRSSNMGMLEPCDSLKTLKCFETFTKLHLKNSGASIVDRCNPEFKKSKAKKKKKETRIRQSSKCKLPPVNLNTNLVRELKHQRIKHKKESEGLPKLP